MSFILSMTQANNPNKYYKGHRSGRIAKTLKKKKILEAKLYCHAKTQKV